MPTKDLYDTQIMAMAISAAKDMYDRGLKLLDDFYDKYGDFVSPLSKDVDWYKKNVTDRVANAIDDMYAHGIDPLRSAEGRAHIARLTRSVDRAKINAMRANAEIEKKRQERIAELQALNKYSADYDTFMRKQLGLPDMNTFSTIDDNGNIHMLDAQTPFQYVSQNEFVTPLVKDLKAGEVTPSEAKAILGDAYDPRRRYSGITESMIRNALAEGMPGLQGSPLYDYYKDVARRLLVNETGKEPTEAAIEQRFQDNAYQSVSRYVTPLTSEADDFAKIQYQHRFDKLRSGGSGSGKGSSSGVYSYLTHALIGAASLLGNNETFVDKQKRIISDAIAQSKSTGSGKWDYLSVIDKLSTSDGSGQILQYWLNRKGDDVGAVEYVHDQDARFLKTAGEIVQDMQGVNIPSANVSKTKLYSDNIRNAIRDHSKHDRESSPTINPTGNALFYTDKYGITHHYIECYVTFAGSKINTNGKSEKTRRKEKMYLDTGMQYDANLDPTGNIAAAIASDQRVSSLLANKSNKTQSLEDPLDD